MDALDEESYEDERARSESRGSLGYETGENYGENEEDSMDSDQLNIDEETLKEMERDLGAIRLTWPEVDLGDSWAAQLSASYRTVNEKEKQLLCHAENFRKQYHAIYANRKPLVLACDNECGVQKFVSTSIRPSTLPYPELFTWQGCAHFVSDHLEYSPPERPLNMVSLFYSSFLLFLRIPPSFNGTEVCIAGTQRKFIFIFLFPSFSNTIRNLENKNCRSPKNHLKKCLRDFAS